MVNISKVLKLEKVAEGLTYKGDYTGAMKIYDKLIKMDRKTPRHYYHKSEIYLKLKQYEKAIQFMEEAKKYQKDPITRQSYNFTIGNIYKEWGNLKKALESFEEGLRDYRGMPAIQQGYSRLANEIREQLMRSERIKRQNEVSSTGDLSSLIDVATEHSKKGEYREAIENWQKVVEIRPDYSTGWVMMGQEYEKLTNWEDAIKCYDKALEVNPRDPEAKWFKEELLERTKTDIDIENLSEKQKGRLSHLYDKMTGILPTPLPGIAMQVAFPETGANVNIIREELFKKGVLELAQNNPRKAIDHWKEFSNNRPDSFEVWSSLGLAYLKVGEHANAIKCIEKAIKINPTNPLDWERLGVAVMLDAHEQHGEDYALEHVMDTSIGYFEKALHYSPNRYDLMYKIGLQYASRGILDRAIEYLEKYLEKIPDDIEALKNLEKMKEQAYQFSKCIECGTQNVSGNKFCSGCGADLKFEKVYTSELLGTPFKSKKAADLFDKGMNSIKTKNLPKANTYFKKVLGIEPNHVEVMEKMGLVYTMNRQPHEAIKMFEKIYSLNPNKMIALDNLSNLYSQTNNREKLQRSIDRIRDAGTKYYDYLIQVGDEFVKGGDLEGCVKYWAKILAFDPEHEEAIRKLEEVSKRRDFKSKVQPTVQATIQQLLSNSFTSILKSYNVDIDELKRIREKQEKEYPGSPTGGKLENREIISLFNKAGALKQQQRYSEAINILKSAVEIDPNIPILYEQLGVNSHLKKDQTTAIKYLEKAIEINPYQVLAWETLATIYHTMGNPIKAEQIFKKLISFGPLYTNYCVDNGKFAFRNRLIPSAATFWQKALMADANNKEAQVYLMMLKDKFTRPQS